MLVSTRCWDVCFDAQILLLVKVYGSACGLQGRRIFVTFVVPGLSFVLEQDIQAQAFDLQLMNIIRHGPSHSHSKLPNPTPILKAPVFGEGPPDLTLRIVAEAPPTCIQ